MITGILLLYVHEQVEVLRVSYRIYQKSSQLAERAEEFRRLKFGVAQLRSPQNLEKKLEDLSFPLTLPREIQVLRVPETFSPPEVRPLPFRVPSNRFFDFIGQWIQIAQARTEQ